MAFILSYVQVDLGILWQYIACEYYQESLIIAVIFRIDVHVWLFKKKCTLYKDIEKTFKP